MSYDSITNHQDYLSPYYLAEVLPRELKAKDGLRARWMSATRPGNPPRSRICGTCGASTSAPARRSQNSRSISPTARRSTTLTAVAMIRT